MSSVLTRGDRPHKGFRVVLLGGVDEGGQTSVYAEHAAVDDGGDVHAVENVAACFPD